MKQQSNEPSEAKKDHEKFRFRYPFSPFKLHQLTHSNGIRVRAAACVCVCKRLFPFPLTFCVWFPAFCVRHLKLFSPIRICPVLSLFPANGEHFRFSQTLEAGIGSKLAASGLRRHLRADKEIGK